MGPSGSGKSTLMDILLGLIKPDKGKILLNGEEIDTQSKKWIDLVTYLPQEPLIMEDTIKTNITINDSINQKSITEKKFELQQNKQI